ncbi:unnamed protein product [Coregonus sp. 'balchen']|nr:unnamed protein product [Coregonus sp. 'balchen']
MAVVSATSNGADENSFAVKEDKKGWLSKRTHFTHRWKPAWFQLKETKLLYGENEEDRKRTFFLRAGTTSEQQGWMEAICEAQLSSRDHATNACVVQ